MNQNLNIDTKLKSTANCICETTSYFYTTWEDRYQTVHSEGIEPVTSYSHSRAITIEIVVENCTYSGPSGDGVDYSDSPASDPYNYLPEPTPVPLSLPAPDYPIESIQAYLKCINSTLSATITIYVDQPVPNSSTPYHGSNVGHSFIGISQGGNTSILGFYPSTYAKPGSTTDVSILGNDSNHTFDVSVSMNVSPSQLAGALYYINNHPETYDLSNYNCTDFAIAIGNMIGMNLPDTQGSWPGGGGSNPGALGQDIRTMVLSDGIGRSITGGSSPSNVSICNQ